MNPLTEIAEIQIVYTPVTNWDKQPTICSSEGAYNVFRDLFEKNTIHLQEQFVVLYLGNDNKLKAAYRHSTGSLTGSLADVRLILGTALKLASVGILIAHNHPSGNMKPSKQDEIITLKIYEAAKQLFCRRRIKKIWRIFQPMSVEN